MIVEILDRGLGYVAGIRIEPPVDVADAHSQSSIGEHPHRYQPCAERLVLVVQSRFLRHLLRFDLLESPRHGLFEGRVDVLLDFVCVLNGRDVCTQRSLGLDGRESVSFVATLRTPGNLSKQEDSQHTAVQRYDGPSHRAGCRKRRHSER